LGIDRIMYADEDIEDVVTGWKPTGRNLLAG
jgi:hypothetical protein